MCVVTRYSLAVLLADCSTLPALPPVILSIFYCFFYVLVLCSRFSWLTSAFETQWIVRIATVLYDLNVDCCERDFVGVCSASVFVCMTDVIRWLSGRWCAGASEAWGSSSCPTSSLRASRSRSEVKSFARRSSKTPLAIQTSTILCCSSIS